MEHHHPHSSNGFGSASPTERRHADEFYAALVAYASGREPLGGARPRRKSVDARDAIEQTGVVVAGTLIDAGTSTPGARDARRIDNARFRVEEILTPVGNEATAAETLRLSYPRQTINESSGEPQPRPGRRYVLFCTLEPRRRLHALKLLPHSAEAARAVTSAFERGARHSAAAIRLA